MKKETKPKVKEELIEFPEHILKIVIDPHNPSNNKYTLQPKEKLDGDNSLVIKDEKRGMFIQLQSPQPIRELIGESLLIKENFFKDEKGGRGYIN